MFPFSFLSLYSLYSPFLASEHLHSYLFLFIESTDLYYRKAKLDSNRISFWYYFKNMTFLSIFTAAYLNTGIILMNQGKTEEARRTFLKCSEIPDENLKDPHAHKSSVTSCLYNLGKLFHEQGHYEVTLQICLQYHTKIMAHCFHPDCQNTTQNFTKSWLVFSAESIYSLQPRVGRC